MPSPIIPCFIHSVIPLVTLVAHPYTQACSSEHAALKATCRLLHRSSLLFIELSPEAPRPECTESDTFLGRMTEPAPCCDFWRHRHSDSPPRQNQLHEGKSRVCSGQVLKFQMSRAIGNQQFPSSGFNTEAGLTTETKHQNASCGETRGKLRLHPRTSTSRSSSRALQGLDESGSTGCAHSQQLMKVRQRTSMSKGFPLIGRVASAALLRYWWHI